MPLCTMKRRTDQKTRMSKNASLPEPGMEQPENAMRNGGFSHSVETSSPKNNRLLKGGAAAPGNRGAVEGNCSLPKSSGA